MWPFFSEELFKDSIRTNPTLRAWLLPAAALPYARNMQWCDAFAGGLQMVLECRCYLIRQRGCLLSILPSLCHSCDRKWAVLTRLGLPAVREACFPGDLVALYARNGLVIQAWQQVTQNGRYKRFDWTLKMDRLALI